MYDNNERWNTLEQKTSISSIQKSMYLLIKRTFDEKFADCEPEKLNRLTFLILSTLQALLQSQFLSRTKIDSRIAAKAILKTCEFELG